MSIVMFLTDFIFLISMTFLVYVKIVVQDYAFAGATLVFTVALILYEIKWAIESKR